ncbi:MAG: M20 family metallopeptidase [Candidatus Eremiobacteraeota bacterium]|nr:M20 family metallopeptidase [Candidatus Eremiobacteraeota bacterium]MBC5826235.1 M20 family metallopeptidase [Candidatus Eremiobacteraeota bacterium]
MHDDNEKLRCAALGRLDAVRDQLVGLSHRIHAHPELGFGEARACAWLTELLSDAGMAVQTGICELPTAFVARCGGGPLHVAICAEYDALPGIGHACGHNLIAAMAAGAGMAVAGLADDLGLTVSIIGTPAEEVGDASGKILLLERGAFDGIHAAMMVHPSPVDAVAPKALAASAFSVRYTGRDSHASAFPELGINALDALTVAQVALGLIRQHIPPAARFHGIVTQGGDAPNIVPAHTEARYIVRAETLAGLADVREKVLRCFQAGALATGASLEIVGGSKPYAELHHDAQLAAAYRRNAQSLGRVFPDVEEMLNKAAGSTDMGNVSLKLPSIHPFIGIDSLPAVNHQPGFAACCVRPAADRAVYDGAAAMALTLIDAATDSRMRERLLVARS